ncbi:hypothetical protein POTOM_011153 [Populus tomentosa]|uniref:S-protein homolog n=1 Tax=Populus tomentosa TaxID=118781 RepID=A0A8X8DBF4_POPTO|nr:hypothetical protein POTOM_011153 [Populus tomentosa]
MNAPKIINKVAVTALVLALAMNFIHCDNFPWSFREDFFLGTLFWCDVSKDKAHAVFKVFWHDVLLFYKCMWKNCIWTVKDDGIYIKNLDHEGLDELYRNWNPQGQ